ncbi:hypothetical protein CPAV1605_1463 [seawater metagenome]|uniref:Uncharacterized protein n=1 Tax=seawater metagenome TaxID=1561972 RepID=A0A5E8CK45_9ZZZZ
MTILLKCILLILFNFEFINGLNNNSKFNNILNNNDLLNDFIDLNGYDMRYSLVEEKDYTIYESIKKNDVLSLLENPALSNDRKIDIINEHDIFNNYIRFNLLAGGLFDDFEFVIE